MKHLRPHYSRLRQAQDSNNLHTLPYRRNTNHSQLMRQIPAVVYQSHAPGIRKSTLQPVRPHPKILSHNIYRLALSTYGKSNCKKIIFILSIAFTWFWFGFRLGHTWTAYVCNGVLPEKWPMKNVAETNANGAIKLCRVYGSIRCMNDIDANASASFFLFISTRWMSSNSDFTFPNGTQPRSHANALRDSSTRPLVSSQYGLSGMKHSAKMVAKGSKTHSIATVRHVKNAPSTNCTNIPVITHVVPVAASIPRNCGCVTSATYVSTYKREWNAVRVLSFTLI